MASTSSTAGPSTLVPPGAVQVDRTFTNGQPADQMILRNTREIPMPYFRVFEERPFFNHVQSRVYDDIFRGESSLIVSAPTGCGKTAVFEMAIVQMLMKSGPSRKDQAVYLAPIKALCDERFRDWSDRFKKVSADKIIQLEQHKTLEDSAFIQIDVSCCKMTGDTDKDDYADMKGARIIVATPEKWDSLTRRWKHNNDLTNNVRLFLVDEVHMIGDSSRGATLETVISRMKFIDQHLKAQNPSSGGIRFVAVSATLNNIEDLRDWLSNSSGPAICHKMGEEIRPVHLNKVILGYPDVRGGEFKFEMSLNYKLAEIINRYSNGKPTMIFCSTRKSVELAAAELRKNLQLRLSPEHRKTLQSGANFLQDSALRDAVLVGVCFHHAGLSLTDKKYVEQTFLEGNLPVLVCTSSLAMGVNLPAHLVVIRGTTKYAGKKEAVELTETELQQMIGRAGRPQFDSSATAVIMTQNSKRARYERQFSGLQLTESCLHTSLIEHINAETSLQTFNNGDSLFQWIKSTFLYIRIYRNPEYYGIPKGMDQLTWLRNLCGEILGKLKEIGLLVGNSDRFDSTPKGEMMARHYISYATMKLFTEIKGEEDIGELLQIISRAEEFTSEVHLRVNEKMTLNTMNSNKGGIGIRYPMKGKIKTTDMKVNCLIQATLGNLPIEDHSLASDVEKIFRSAKRVLTCLMTYVRASCDQFAIHTSALVLTKCVDLKMWPDSPFVSRQLTGIGPAYSSRLVNAGYTNFQSIANADPRMLEVTINRKAPYGHQLVDAARRLPRYEITINQSGESTFLAANIVVTLVLKNVDIVRASPTAGKSHSVYVFVGNAANEALCREKVVDGRLMSGPWNKHIRVSRTGAGDELRVEVLSETHVGFDVSASFTPTYNGTGTLPVVAENFGAPSGQKRLRQTSLNFPVTKRAKHNANDYSPVIVDSPSPGSSDLLLDDADDELFLNISENPVPVVFSAPSARPNAPNILQKLKQKFVSQ